MGQGGRAVTGGLPVSTFYLLPPRAVLGDCLASFLHGLFPGLDWDAPRRAEMAEALGAAAGAHPDVYVVYRDDLPAGELPGRALADGFGARPGDEVVEVRTGGRAGEVSARRWRLG
jgi:hypothetical protein